jgi:hypothetical protein
MATATSNSVASQGLASRSAPEPAIAKVTAHGRSLNRGRSAATLPWVAALTVLAVGGAVVVLVLAFGWYGARPASSARIRPEAYARIKEGMRLEEMQAAIGLPPGDYRDRAHSPGGRSYTEWSEKAGAEEYGAGESAGWHQWEGNAYSISVGFDETGGATWKTLWEHVPPTPRSPLDHLRARLGL